MPTRNSRKKSQTESQATPPGETSSPSDLNVMDLHTTENNESLTLEEALLAGFAESAVVQIYENERPLLGCAAELDRLFQGALSQAIQEGFLTGEKGEIALLPLPMRHGKAPFLIVLGMGPHAPRGIEESLPRRKAPSPDLIESLKKNLLTLHPPKPGMSRQDFGGKTLKQLNLAELDLTLFR